MSTYAIKIGEVLLKSDKPISEETRKAAVMQMKKFGPHLTWLDPKTEVALTIHSH